MKFKSLSVFVCAVLAIFVCGLYSFVELQLRWSYYSRNCADLFSALRHAELARIVARYIYFPASDREHEAVLNALNLWVALADAGGYDISAVNLDKNPAFRIAIQYSKELGNRVSRETQARFDLEVARIFNAELATNIAGILTANRTKDLDVNNKEGRLLDAELREENDFASLVGPAIPVETQSEFAAEFEKSHSKNQSEICDTDPIVCRTNEARWVLGRCIHAVRFIKAPQKCAPDQIHSVLSKSVTCKGLTAFQCHTVMSTITPYIIKLNSLEGAENEQPR